MVLICCYTFKVVGWAALFSEAIFFSQLSSWGLSSTTGARLIDDAK